MALDAYNSLEKSRHSSSSSPSDLQNDPSRFSFESDGQDSSVNELDPLNSNGTKHDGSDISLLHKAANGQKAYPDIDRWEQIRRGRIKTWKFINGYIPVSRVSQWSALKSFRSHIPIAKLRLLRKEVGLSRIPRYAQMSPGRFCCVLMGIIAAIMFMMTSSAGVYVYRKGTIDGKSEPWYPAPPGGRFKTWEDSYNRAAMLVQQMTLAEKVNITTGTGWQMGMCVGNTGPALSVGFPSLCLQDGPLGLRFTDHITASPAGITTGATWNRDLIRKRGRMLGLEARMKGVNILLGPSVGPLGRMPAGGRNWEGFGADPVLQGNAAFQTIKGIQEEGVMATVKHYVGNEQEHFRRGGLEWGTPNALSANIDDRTMHEVYAWPFSDSVRAGVASVQCSYNQINNSYACQNSKLINNILKDELGFQGFVMSDWNAQRSGVASALAGLDMSMPGDGKSHADGKPFWGSQLSLAVLNNSVPIARLNDMVTRIVAAWYQLGQDDPSKWPQPPPLGDGGPNFSSWTNEERGLLHHGSNDKAEGVVNKFVKANRGYFSHRALSRQIAAEGTVLLKNKDGILPLNRNGWPERDQLQKALLINDDKEKFRFAVYGDDAGPAPGGPNACQDRSCNKGTLATGWGSGAVDFPYLVTPVEALQPVFRQDKVQFTEFTTNELPSKRNDTSIDHQDLCMVFVNADSGEGYLKAGGIRGDRKNLRLQNNGDALINEVASRCGSQNPRNVVGLGADQKHVNSPTVVVIHAVGPVILESFIENPNVQAVLHAHLPGQESGHALVDILFGDINPSGKLPYTIAKKEEHYGKHAKVMYFPNSVVPQQDFSEGLLIDYRWFDQNKLTPRYEFGYGLTYTKFALRDFSIRRTDGSDKPPNPLPNYRPPDELLPPRYGTEIPAAQEVLFPTGFHKLKKYIYPYIDSLKKIKKGRYPAIPGRQRRSISPAGGRVGGNPALHEVMVKVDVTIVNEGDRNGLGVIQLYVVFPENVWEGYDEDWDDVINRKGKVKFDPTDPEPDKPNPMKPGRVSERIEFPPRVLRGFRKIHTYARKPGGNPDGAPDGHQKKITFDLTRRDLSYWSVRQQNWVFPTGAFGIEVGFSSRDIRQKQTVFRDKNIG